jgi:hypothetical protein
MERLFSRLLVTRVSLAHLLARAAAGLRTAEPSEYDGSNGCRHRAERIYPNGTPACAVDLS